MAVLTEEQIDAARRARSLDPGKDPGHRVPQDARQRQRRSATTRAAFDRDGGDGLDRRHHPRGVRRLRLRLPEPRPGAGRDRPHADRLAAAVHRARRGQRADPRRHATRRRKPGCRRSPQAKRSRTLADRRRPAPRAGEGRAGRRRSRGAGYTLTGKKTFVLEGMAADLFIVSARTSGKPGDKDGITLFLVAGRRQGRDAARR